MSVLTDIADAVTATLNAAVLAGAFSLPFTAERGHLPERDLADYSDLTVLVVVKGYEKIPINRLQNQWTVAIDVGTIQHLATDSKAEIDGLLTLVDQMATPLERRLEVVSASWVGTASDPHFSRDHLQQKNTFFSVVTYSYLTVRPR